MINIVNHSNGTIDDDDIYVKLLFEGKHAKYKSDIRTSYSDRKERLDQFIILR
jgi:uncharacterized protein YjbJ (UPF0337 family)